MPKFTEMDSKITLMQQMEADVSPVVLINRFTVAPEEAGQLLTAWAADAAFVNVAAWESVAHFKRAFFHPTFQAALKDYPPSAEASPHLFSKVTVPNICVAG